MTVTPRLRTALVVFAIALAVFSALAGERLLRASPNNHFAYLAESYMAGRLDMLERPPHGNDWASVDTLTLASGDTSRGVWLDRSRNRFRATTGELYVFTRDELRGVRSERTYYVSFPPLPALIMMPGVAIWGTAFNDVLFTVVFAAANCALFWLLLLKLRDEDLSRLRPADEAWLTVLFGLGTAHGWCAVNGSVWFTALVIGVTCTLAYAHFTVGRPRPFLAGLALACGFATRAPLLYTVVFFAAFFFFPGGRLRRDWGIAFWRDGILFAIAPLVTGLTLMALNAARFDDPGEFGHTYLAAGQIERIRDYGLFNVHFLSRNLAAMFALVPQFLPEAPWVRVSNHGLALWFTTPALLAFLGARYREDARSRLLQRASLAALIVVAITHAFYQNTGWVQFGYRFSLDYLVYLIVLLAIGRERVGWLLRTAIVLSVAVNVFGAITFDRMPRFYAEWLLEP